MRFPCPNSSDITDVLARIEAHYSPKVVRFFDTCDMCNAKVPVRELSAALDADGDECSVCSACDAKIGGEP